jgi:hypothetical protein
MFSTKTCTLAITLFAGLAAAGVDVDEPKVADGQSIQIESVAQPGRLLRVEDAKSANGTPIVLYPNQAWKCMTWQLQADGGGFRLKNHFTNKTLTPTTAPADEATPVVQKPLDKTPAKDEAWMFVPIDGKAGLFHIIHEVTGRALEAGDDGDVIANKPSDQPAQEWRLLEKPTRFTG